MKSLIVILVGFCGGVATGGGLVAFLAVLGVITRVIEILNNKQYLIASKIIILLGVVSSSFMYFLNLTVSLPKITALLIGVIMGIFVGMIVGALAETLDIVTSITDILDIPKWIYLIVLVIILGKVLGSVLYWIVPGFYSL